MKRLFLIATLCFIASDALALSCPNNGAILDEGDSIQTVLAQCGPPDSQKNSLRTVNVVVEDTASQYHDPTGNGAGHGILLQFYQT